MIFIKRILFYLKRLDKYDSLVYTVIVNTKIILPLYYIPRGRVKTELFYNSSQKEVDFMYKINEKGNRVFYRRTDEELREELNKSKENDCEDKFWQDVIREFDHSDYLNDYKHTRYERRHEQNIIAKMDQIYDGDKPIKFPRALLDVCKCDNWIDIMYSKTPDEIENLIEDAPKHNAIKPLKYKHKELLHKRLILGYSITEISQQQNCSNRNTRKIYKNLVGKLQKSIDKSNIKCYN